MRKAVIYGCVATTVAIIVAFMLSSFQKLYSFRKESREQIDSAVTFLCNEVDPLDLRQWGQELIRDYDQIEDERISARDSSKYIVRGSEQYDRYVGGSVAEMQPPYVNVGSRSVQVPIVEKGRCGIYIFREDVEAHGDFELTESVWLYGAQCGAEAATFK